ncbi:MAG: hypothetical protein QM769_07420 [Pseudoxanthomonas sp.]
MKPNLGHAVLAMALIAVAAWWWSTRDQRAPTAASASSASVCPLPPRVARGGAPLQSDAPASLSLFVVDQYTLQPLAGFSIDARVLSRENYRMGREADLSPTDLALGWNRMADDAVLSAMSISQGGRFFYWRTPGEPPIPVPEITRSATNAHLIPADDAVARALAAVRKDERVRIDGWLVEARATDGWHWRSSLSREDSGAGACELIYVCAIERAPL